MSFSLGPVNPIEPLIDSAGRKSWLYPTAAGCGSEILPGGNYISDGAAACRAFRRCASIVTAKSSLALLVARYPEEINALLDSHSDLPDYRQIVATGMPGELLRRRPDIIAAEQNLAAAAAAVGIAKKDFLPTLSINGSIGFAGPKLNDTFNKSGFSYSIAPTLSWTIFDGMARNAKVAAARDEMEVQMANYNYTVMNAYNEVNNAVNSYINNVKP